MNNLSKKQQVPPPSANFSAFVSYCSKDTQRVRPIVDYIAQIQGLNIFFAEISLQPGDSIGQRIVQNITNANVFLLFHSQCARESTYVQQEIGVAIANNKIIVPLLLDDIKPSGMLEGVQYLKLNDPHTIGSEAERLFKFLSQGVQQKIQDDRNRMLGLLAFAGIGVWLLGSGLNSDSSDESYDE